MNDEGPTAVLHSRAGSNSTERHFATFFCLFRKLPAFNLLRIHVSYSYSLKKLFPYVMKSKPNLTRFTYETAAFEGWRLCISRGGKTFTKYYSDKQFGGPRQSLAAAESKLAALKDLLENSRKMNGKLTQTTIRKAEKLLKEG
ncbi:hypothetical protein [Roseibacillus ishigakijimensis]|nr:hypothetical protein [Roseibacillus ishigakijimensis]